MPTIDKKSLSEQDIRTQYIPPAIKSAGWYFASQVCEEVSFTKGRIIARGKVTSRGFQKRAVVRGGMPNRANPL
jgi:type I restriction enzyme, R subunit